MTNAFLMTGYDFRADHVITGGDLRRFAAVAVEDGGSGMSTKVQDAINSGEELYVPYGKTFLIDAPLTARAKLVMRGAGTLKLANGTNGMLLDCENAYRSQISDVQFDGNGVNQTVGAPIVRMRNCAYARLRELYIVGGKQDGLVLENYNGSVNADEVNVNDCHVFSNARDNLQLTYSRATASGTIACTAGVTTFSLTQAGIAKPDQQVLVGGTAYQILTFNGTFGATLAGAPTFAASAFTYVLQPIGDCIISQNHLNYSGRYGGYNKGGSSNIVKDNNVLTNYSHGWFSEGIPTESSVSRATFSGNKFRNNGNNGFYQYGGGTRYQNGSLIFVHNECHYNNALGAGSDECDIWDTNYVNIANNHFGASPQYTSRALYGLQLSRADNVKRGGNIYYGNVTGDSTNDAFCTFLTYAT